jgi:replication-associated recombination protein RarA
MKDFLKITRPTNSDEVVGNRKEIDNIRIYLSSCKSGGNIIVGPIGIGKTLSINLLCDELGYSLHVYNFCDIDLDLLDQLNYKQVKNIYGKRILYLFDNYYDCSEKIIKKIKEIFNTTKVPIFIITNDLYPLKSLDNCNIYKFIRPVKTQIRNFLIGKKVFTTVNDTIKKKIDDVISSYNNDIRYILNKFTVKNVNIEGELKAELNIFEMVNLFFNHKLPKKERMDVFWDSTYLVPLLVMSNTDDLDLLSLADTYNTLDILKKYECIFLMYCRKNTNYPKYPKNQKIKKFDFID